MIGQATANCQTLNSKNSFATHQINGGGVLINQISENVINVKNTPVDFDVLVQEASLANDVCQNEDLRAGSSIDQYSSPAERMTLLGMGITAVHDSSENCAAKALTSEPCKLWPRTVSGDFKSDPAMLKRGEHGVRDLANKKNHLTATTYAAGLSAGHRMDDPVSIKNFADLFVLTMTLEQNDAEKAITGPTQDPREVFGPD